jgi:hypothetical protein
MPPGPAVEFRTRCGPGATPTRPSATRFDNSLAPFHVNDVAALIYECKRLWRLERRIIRALGPPAQQMRYDKKLDKLVPDESDPED